MSTAAFAAAKPSGLRESQVGLTAPRWPLISAALVVGLAFFISEHDLRISLVDAYTQTADEMEVTAEGGNLLRRLAFPAIAAWGLVLLATSRDRLRLDPLLAGAIGLLLTWTGISVVWADDPDMCLRRLILLACCVVGAAGIARQLPMRDLSLLTMLVLGSLAAAGVLAELSLGTFQPWDSEYRFAGTVHPNTQSAGLAAVCLAALGLAGASRRGRWWYAAIFAAALALLVLTKSRTSVAGLLLAIGFVAIVQSSLKFKVVAGLAGAWTVCLGLWILFVAGIDPLADFRDALLLGRAEDSDTLSGRAFIWPEVACFISRRPWLGYGYESFWTPAHIETISEVAGWGLREAHNAYLETLLWLGLVGLILMLVVVGAGLLAGLRGYFQSRDATYALPLGMLVFGLLNAGLESGIVAIETVTFIIGCCLLRMALYSDRRTSMPTTDK
jgi:exopolysaccharide production protein ExoQ